MSQFPAETCFNCRRTSEQVPMLSWTYRGGELWACSECMPLLIHKLDRVLAALGAGAEEEEATSNEDGE